MAKEEMLQDKAIPDDSAFDDMFNEMTSTDSEKASQQEALESKQEVEVEQEARQEEEAQQEEQKEDPFQSLRDEIAALKAQLTERLDQPKQEAKPDEQKQDEPVPEDIQSLYEDFPAFQKAAQFEAQRLVKQMLPDIIDQRLGGVNLPDLVRKIELDRFENDVTRGFYDETGSFVAGVPDAREICNDQKYWKWFEEKGYQPGDQRTAVKILNEYKAHVARQAAEQKAQEFRGKANRMQQALSGTIESRNRGGVPVSDKKDLNAMPFEDAFDAVVDESASTTH